MQESGKKAALSEGVTFVRQDGGDAVFTVGSGTYAFRAPQGPLSGTPAGPGLRAGRSESSAGAMPTPVVGMSQGAATWTATRTTCPTRERGHGTRRAVACRQVR